MNRYNFLLLILFLSNIDCIGQDFYFDSNFRNGGVEYVEIICTSWSNEISLKQDSINSFKSNPKIVYIKLRALEKLSWYLREFKISEKDSTNIKFTTKIIVIIHWWNKNVDTFEFGDIKKRIFKLNNMFYKFNDLLFKYILEYIPSYYKLQFELYEH